MDPLDGRDGRDQPVQDEYRLKLFLLAHRDRLRFRHTRDDVALLKDDDDRDVLFLVRRSDDPMTPLEMEWLPHGVPRTVRRREGGDNAGDDGGRDVPREVVTDPGRTGTARF